MSENNYGAMMIKSAVGVSDDINEILSPGIYLIPPANTSSPDSGGGALIIHSGSPIRRTFTSDSVICLTSTRNGNAWTSWRGPLSRKNPFADIKADGSAAIAEALSNLGLDVVVNGGSQVWLTSSSGKYHIFIGEDGSWGMWNEENSQNVPLSIIGGGTGGNTKQEAQLNLGLGCGLPPIGIPFYWPSAAMPNTVIPEWSGMTFLKLNGATFTAAQYPKLALVWPGLKLTETRGEFIRVADDGRGVDTGRALLSAQGDAMRNLTGNIEGRTAGSIGRIFSNNANGVFSATGEGGDFITPTLTSGAPGDRLSNLNLDASRQVSTANEFRPRNVAFNFLVRAA
ncbi:TPA: phage tail protein [Escherichia coli]|nr:phage tail protein [Citrobacter freundii]